MLLVFKAVFQGAQKHGRIDKSNRVESRSKKKRIFILYNLLVLIC